MEREKRMIGEYEVLTSFRIGNYEIALCENETAPKDEVFLCGNIESNGIWERLTDCLVSESYADIAACYGERIAEKAEEVQKETKWILQAVKENGVLTEKDVQPISDGDRLEGRVIVLRGNVLRPEYKRATSQLLLCTGGFGAKVSPRGSTCFAVRLYDAGKTQCRREDILGVILEERLPEWAKSGLSAICRYSGAKEWKRQEER